MNGSSPQTNITDEMAMQRHRMIERLRDHYNISDESVLEVLSRVPRHNFVPEAIKSQAYKDNALPISAGQTISQPFIVARMTELLELTGDEKVLEIGAGSGYQTAVLASLAYQVFAIERIAKLADSAELRLMKMGIENFAMKCDDGTVGWEKYAPFDAILVAAGGPVIPEPLIVQLKIGGRLVIPIGEELKTQTLVRAIRTENGYETETHGPCAFVPLIGEHGWQ